jgi:methionyl-tRNA synthetase
VVQADTIARLYRRQGYNVRLQAGTDENSIKNVQAAEAAGIPVAELVKQHAAQFIALKTNLNLSYDDFIRTSADARHRRGVERLWKACFERGDIYRRAYSGLYCTGCEQFYKIADLDEGRCPEHGTRPELIEEENWFFRLLALRGCVRRALCSPRDRGYPRDTTQRGVVVDRRWP